MSDFSPINVQRVRAYLRAKRRRLWWQRHRAVIGATLLSLAVLVILVMGVTAIGA